MAESFNDALIECVKACGGSKVVGLELWPAKGVEAAQRQLLACLNPDRNEKLSPDETLHVMRLARAKGCHVAMSHLATELNYAEPVPIEPKDELADLLRKYLARRESDRAEDTRLAALVAQAVKP